MACVRREGGMCEGGMCEEREKTSENLISIQVFHTPYLSLQQWVDQWAGLGVHSWVLPSPSLASSQLADGPCLPRKAGQHRH